MRQAGSARIKALAKNYLNYAVIVVALILFAVLSLTGSAKLSTLLLLEKIAISVILSVSLCMVVGFLGELSLGHAGCMCVGAFLGGKAAALLTPILGNSFLTLFLSMLTGGLIAALFGVIIGLPALRLRGDYLAIVTLAFGEIIRSLVMNAPASWFGGTLGLPTPKFNSKYLFIVAFLMVLACLAVTQNLLRSKHGRAISSIRDNEIAARATGVDVTKYKLFVFTISAFFAGIAGVLYSYTQTRVQSVNFDYNYSIEILVMVVLGGLGNINGSIIAAILITFLDVELQTRLPGDLAVLQDLFYALILIVIVIYKNAPKLKSFRERHNLKNLMKKRRSPKDSEATSSGKEDEAHG